MKIVTGSTGISHVKPNDDGGLYASIFGEGCYVLGAGDRFPCTIISDTQVQIGQGEGLMYGRHFRTPVDSVDQLTLMAGAEGYNRADIIAVHYKNVGGVESVELVVLAGTATASAAQDPYYAQEDISKGATESYMPLYRVRLTGTSIVGVDTLFTLKDMGGGEADLNNLKKDVNALKSSVAGLNTSLAGKASKFLTTATIGTVWSGSGPYTQSITVSGVLASDAPIIDLLPSTDANTAAAELDAWSKIYRIDTAANSITVYASEVTELAVTIQILGVR